MSRKKKILLLGGSAQQVPAIRLAKDMGYETVLIDYLPDNPGQYVADKWFPESTTDVEAVYRIAKEEGVSGILAYASDPAALPAAIVCERLGLPTNPAASVEILGVKHKFRQFLRENGFPCPGIFIIQPGMSEDEVRENVSKLSFPIVIKPTDSSGSKGVSFLEDDTQIAGALEFARGFSRNGILIAEEFIHRGYPDVIGGDVFVVDGKIKLCGAMACLRDDGGKSLIPTGEKIPNGLSQSVNDAIKAELQKLVDTLNIKNGELNIEILIDRSDTPCFLEVGPRAGGNMIPIELSDAYNVDLIKANIQAAMGEEIELAPVIPSECYMTFVLHSHEDGIFDHIHYSEEILPYIYRKVEYKKRGDVVEQFDGAGKALGIVFMKIPGVELMNNIQADIDNLIQVVLK